MSAFADQLRNRTRAFALRVIKMTQALPRNATGRVLGNQILRSGTSIGANYCEAHRSRSKVEFRAKIGECLKEAEETAYWIELITDAELLPAPRLGELRSECSELIAIFAVSAPILNS